MALAAVATLAVSAVAAPAPAHAQRYLGAAVAGGLIGGAIVGGAIAAGPGYYGGYGPGYYGPGYGYYGGPAYVAAPGRWTGLLLAAAALLGWLRLADLPRPGLRLILFIFVTNTASPETAGFRGRFQSWPEKTVFQAKISRAFALN